MENYRNEQLRKYIGIKGWLLLLCLILTIFSPLASIYNLTSSYIETSDLFYMFPGIERLFYIDSVLSIVMIGLSIRAGIALWTVKPGAVKMAKNYFLFFLAYNAIAIMLPFTAGLPAEVNSAMIPEITKNAIQSLIFFGVWFSYLNASKRVKATYNTDISSEEFEDIFVEKYR